MASIRVCVDGSTVTLFSTLGSSTISATGDVDGVTMLTTQDSVDVSVEIQGGQAIFTLNNENQSALMLTPDSQGLCAALS